MIQDLAPLIGRRLSLGVVPNWHGKWPLAADRVFCRMVRENSEEFLLHGYFHQRQRGRGPVTLLTDAGDEMNGLTLDETRRVLEQGQRDFVDALGEPARGFVAPAWQVGQMHSIGAQASGLDYVMGFFSIVSHAAQSSSREACEIRIPLSTWTWDCGRWGWLGHIGNGVGHLQQFLDRGVPVLAIHPRDLRRGFWPRIHRLTEDLLKAGYEPTTAARLLEAGDVEVAV